MSVCDIGDSLITIDELGRGIFQIDKRDMSTHFLTMIRNIKNRRNLYQCAELFNDAVFFFPFSFVGTEIIVYHLTSRQVEYIALWEMNDLIQGEYRPAKRVDNLVWLFPIDFSRDAIIFHMDNYKVEINVSWKQFMHGIKLDYTDNFAKVSLLAEVKNSLYYVVNKTNYIVEIDKKSYKMKSHMLPMDIILSATIDYDGQNLWISELNNKGMVAWNPETNNMHYNPVIVSDNKWQQGNWVRCVLCGKRYLWVIPRRDNRLLRMNYETGNCEFINIFPQEFYYSEKRSESLFYTIVKNGNVADIYPFIANMVLHLDLENDILLERHEQIFFPAEWSEQDILDYQLQKDNEYEPERIVPEAYMNFFFQNVPNSKEKKQGCNNGEHIWNQLSGE